MTETETEGENIKIKSKQKIPNEASRFYWHISRSYRPHRDENMV